MNAAEPPFFVVGNDRSGTTMLRLVLDRSAEAAIPPESMFLVDFEPVRRHGGLDDARLAQQFAERVWSHPKVRLWGLPGPPPVVPAGLAHADAYRFAVEAPFRAYAAAHGKQRWGDKTPLYLRSIEQLLEIWPSARIVVLVRDGRDVALSIIRVPFGANNVWAAARSWGSGVRIGSAAERLHAQQVASVRYEDLVADPRHHVRRLCEFLSLTYDDEMLAIEQSDPAKIVKDEAGWFTNISEGINTGPVGKWRGEMTARDQRVFAAVAGRELADLGYEPGEPLTLGWLAQLGYALDDSAMRGINFVRLRLVQQRGRELGYVLRRKLASADAEMGLQRAVKAVADRVLSACLLVLLSPVFGVTAIWILLDDGRPVLFVQPRAGKDGVPFRMFKFRTLVRDAIEIGRREQLSEDPFGIVPNDPRITRSGGFLRRTGLDELPQLVNILRGQMSLVGPRPDLVEQAAHYTTHDRRRLAVLPGLTGWSQTHGREEISWPERIEHDIWYIEHWSLWLDVKILLATFAQFFRPEPAPIVDTMNIERHRAATAPQHRDCGK